MTTATSIKREKKARIYKVRNGDIVQLVRAYSRSGAIKGLLSEISANIATQDEILTYGPQVELIDATKLADL
jgi:hypothetical protein